MMTTRTPRILLLTPPLLQTNTPYPATMHLTGFLESRGFDVHQRDLSIKVVRDILLDYGDETTEELLEFLGGSAPLEAKREASKVIDELAIWIRDNVDPEFGFSRYAEAKCRAVDDFGKLVKLVNRRGVMDRPLERHLKAAMDEVKPTAVGVTCPFPGTLVGAFKIAKYVRKHYPKVRLLLGGGYVNTELRSMTDRRPYRYFDEFQYDEGYGNFLGLDRRYRSTRDGKKSIADIDLKPIPKDIPAFVRPSYRGIDWDEYFDVVETDNFVANLWNSGKWVKLVMARGCYWHKCAFCDVVLPYIGCFRMPKAKDIVDAMEELATRPVQLQDTVPSRPPRLAKDGRSTVAAPVAEAATARKMQLPLRSANYRLSSFHFVDEAMPPAVIRGMCEEILRRGLKVEWWGNIRFDEAFTPALAKLMAKAGCIAVTGGLECANERLLKLMNKGITLAGAEKVLKAFRSANIFVHAYLMYDFPTETKAEQKGAEKYVKDLAKRGLIQSCFWHRFALTVHSPIAREPEKFGIIVKPSESKFARNELEYRRKDFRRKT